MTPDQLRALFALPVSKSEDGATLLVGDTPVPPDMLAPARRFAKALGLTALVVEERVASLAVLAAQREAWDTYLSRFRHVHVRFTPEAPSPSRVSPFALARTEGDLPVVIHADPWATKGWYTHRPARTWQEVGPGPALEARVYAGRKWYTAALWDNDPARRGGEVSYWRLASVGLRKKEA